MGTNISLSARISPNALSRYGLAVAAILVATFACIALNPLLGNQSAYILLLPAIAFCSWYCGLGPSIMAIVLSLLELAYGLVPRIHSWVTPDRGQLGAISLFLLAALAVAAMGESRRRDHERLRNTQDDLEIKVRQRTSDLAAVNRNLRDLSARLLELQDHERRRIARELHDSVGQMLAALSMNLSTVRADLERLDKTAAALIDSESLVKEMSTEVRTISHLLHPPLLDEAGLASALPWFVNGFAQRSGIKVDLDLPNDFARLPSEMETAIFRVVQECLTNIHRHSGSPVAKIQVRQHEEQVFVKIEDQGKGIPPEKTETLGAAGTPGVGLRGMRERLRQLGGTLEIESSNAGTVVAVRLPLKGAASETIALEDRSTPAAA
jgi:signal transduction histidine kinase